MVYATATDVQDRYDRTLSGPELDRVGVWIGDLEAEIVERIPNLAELILAGRPSLDTLKRVISVAIIRHLDNPKGLKSRTVSVDDYSTKEDPWIQGTPGGGPELSDDDWSKLLPGSTGDAFSIRPWGSP